MAGSPRSSDRPGAESAAAPGARDRTVALDPRVAQRRQHLTLAAAQAADGFLARRPTRPPPGVPVQFVERRQYVRGDDLRQLDWKSYARNDRLAIKRYEEETNLECTLVVDASASMAYPPDVDGAGPGAGRDSAPNGWPSKYD